MTHHDNEDWRTVSVTPLTPGVIATVQFGRDETDNWQWPAVGLLRQTRGQEEQIVPGVLNESGEVEPCYSGCSDDNPCGLELVRIDYGPYMTHGVPQPDSTHGHTPASVGHRNGAVAQQDSRL